MDERKKVKRKEEGGNLFLLGVLEQGGLICKTEFRFVGYGGSRSMYAGEWDRI